MHDPVFLIWKLYAHIKCVWFWPTLSTEVCLQYSNIPAADPISLAVQRLRAVGIAAATIQRHICDQFGIPGPLCIAAQVMIAVGTFLLLQPQ